MKKYSIFKERCPVRKKKHNIMREKKQTGNIHKEHTIYNALSTKTQPRIINVRIWNICGCCLAGLEGEGALEVIGK